jgi:hypothetical protein
VDISALNFSLYALVLWKEAISFDFVNENMFLNVLGSPFMSQYETVTAQLDIKCQNKRHKSRQLSFSQSNSDSIGVLTKIIIESDFCCVENQQDINIFQYS